MTLALLVVALVSTYDVPPQPAVSCGNTHGWRAHMKCAPGDRDSCGGSVRQWRGIEAELRGIGTARQT